MKRNMLAIIILALVLICAFVYIQEIVKSLKEPDEEAPKQSMDEDEMKRRIAEEVEKLKQQKAQQDAQGEGSSPAESAGSGSDDLYAGGTRMDPRGDGHGGSFCSDAV